MFELTVVSGPLLKLRLSKNLEVVLGVFQDKLIVEPFRLDFAAEISGVLGAVVSIVKVELAPAFEVFVYASTAYRL